jgi:hypothetical protein
MTTLDAVVKMAMGAVGGRDPAPSSRAKRSDPAPMQNAAGDGEMRGRRKRGRRGCGGTAGSLRCARDDGQTCTGKSANRRSPPSTASRFGDFLVALVVAAFGDEFARDRELRVGFLQQPRGLGGVGGRGRAGAVQRREGFAARERKPRALQREIAQKKPHRPQLCDLLDLVEIAPGGGPVADAASQSGAGKQAAWRRWRSR